MRGLHRGEPRAAVLEGFEIEVMLRAGNEESRHRTDGDDDQHGAEQPTPLCAGRHVSSMRGGT